MEVTVNVEVGARGDLFSKILCEKTPFNDQPLDNQSVCYMAVGGQRLTWGGHLEGGIKKL